LREIVLALIENSEFDRIVPPQGDFLAIFCGPGPDGACWRTGAPIHAQDAADGPAAAAGTDSRRNVAHHYDLDGWLYSLFLDAAIILRLFESPDQSLDGVTPFTRAKAASGCRRGSPANNRGFRASRFSRHFSTAPPAHV
jgi:hypothetical protein